MKTPLFLVICATLALSACNRDEEAIESAPLPSAATENAVQPGTAAIAPSDPSLPSASGAVGSTSEAPAHAGQDSAANPPDSEMSKREESETMPQSGQANNYSTPARDEKHGTGSN